ncbi:MAG: hypothetical protein HZB99_01230 [Candidatus Harrisonbacteria bacterium]|nr:hypothetical protein [Candidatus Harrisonbacteria bacterium]
MGEKKGFWARQSAIQKEGLLFWAIFSILAYVLYYLWVLAWGLFEKIGFSFTGNLFLNFLFNVSLVAAFLYLTGFLLRIDLLRNFVFGILKLFPVIGNLIESYEQLKSCKEVEFELVPGSYRYTLGWVSDRWQERDGVWYSLNNPLQAWPGGDTWKMREVDLHFTGRSGFHTYLTCLSGGLYRYPRWKKAEGCLCPGCRASAD